MTNPSTGVPPGQRYPSRRAALEWAAAGWPVIPCDPDSSNPDHWKSPLTERGKDDATRDEEQIRKWWARHPFALVGGRTDGLVVLDLDSYKPGHGDDLAALPGELPPTRTHRTARGGTHLIYADPEGLCRSGKLGRTIDVRAGTSRDYIILPCPGSGYEVAEDRPPADVPGWLPEAVGGSPRNAETPAGLPDPEPLPDPLPARLRRALRAPSDDPSKHTYHLTCEGVRAKLTDGKLLALLELDEITSERRAEQKRQQPDWWPKEFWRVVGRAREAVAAERSKRQTTRQDVRREKGTENVGSATTRDETTTCDGPDVYTVTPHSSLTGHGTGVTGVTGTPAPPGAVAGLALLDGLHGELTSYVVFSSPEAADAVTLWAVATHAQAAWPHATRLPITSPEKQCGKSRLMDVLAEVSHRPLATSNISAAALVRIIDENDPPTIFLDEADAIFAARKGGSDDKAEILRGIINAGHRRGQEYIRWNMQASETERCPTFAMVALASIDDLPDTIMDRGPVIRMERRAPGEEVRSWRQRRDAPALHKLRDQIHEWVQAHLDELRDAEPELPVDDRPADNWESLVAVADLAGGDWPARARKAALRLTSDESERAAGESLGVRLLFDIRSIFETEAAARNKKALPSQYLAGQLRRLKDSPWIGLGRHGIEPNILAKLLAPYDIRPKPHRNGKIQQRGYNVNQFAGAFARYLPDHPAPPDPPGGRD